MTIWEYRARIFWVNKDDKIVKEYHEKNYPEWEWKKVPKYHPIVLEALLNSWGKDGWELVSIELGDSIGRNGDFGTSYHPLISFRQAYYCVFKRPTQT